MQCSLLHCLAKYPGSGHCMPWGSTAQEPKIQSPKIKSHHHPPHTHSPFSSLRDLHIVRRMHELYSVACFSHSAASCVYMHCERVNEHGTCVASAELSLPQSFFYSSCPSPLPLQPSSLRLANHVALGLYLTSMIYTRCVAKVLAMQAFFLCTYNKWCQHCIFKWE